MKKLLAMVLALVMTLSLAVSANAAFKDVKDIDETYAESAAVLNGLGVFKGYEEKDGTFSFQPKNAITRAEVAAIVYRIYTGDVKDAYVKNYETYNKFGDMAGAGWAKGYIGYCANAALVKGYPNGTFAPSGKVTGYEVLAMILRAVGYDQKGEFTGADWALHVAEIAERQGILDNVKGVDLNAPATREVVAELLFRTVAYVPMVTYTAAFGYQNVGLNEKAENKIFAKNETLGTKNFTLDCVTGYVTANDTDAAFKNMQIAGKNLAKKDDTVKVADQDIFDAGRYGHVWTSDGSAITDVFYDDTLLSTTYDGTSYKNLTDKDADEFVAKADKDARFFDNGYEQDAISDVTVVRGTELKLYTHTSDKTVDSVVALNQSVAQLTADPSVKNDKVKIDTDTKRFDLTDKTASGYEELKEDDVALYVKMADGVTYFELAKSVTGEKTKAYYDSSKTNVKELDKWHIVFADETYYMSVLDGRDDDANLFSKDADTFDEKAIMFLDRGGNVIRTDLLTEDSQYVMIIDSYVTISENHDKTVYKMNALKADGTETGYITVEYDEEVFDALYDQDEGAFSPNLNRGDENYDGLGTLVTLTEKNGKNYIDVCDEFNSYFNSYRTGANFVRIGGVDYAVTSKTVAFYFSRVTLAEGSKSEHEVVKYGVNVGKAEIPTYQKGAYVDYLEGSMDGITATVWRGNSEIALTNYLYVTNVSDVIGYTATRDPIYEVKGVNADGKVVKLEALDVAGQAAVKEDTVYAYGAWYDDYSFFQKAETMLASIKLTDEGDLRVTAEGVVIRNEDNTWIMGYEHAWDLTKTIKKDEADSYALNKKDPVRAVLVLKAGADWNSAYRFEWDDIANVDTAFVINDDVKYGSFGIDNDVTYAGANYVEYYGPVSNWDETKGWTYSLKELIDGGYGCDSNADVLHFYKTDAENKDYDLVNVVLSGEKYNADKANLTVSKDAQLKVSECVPVESISFKYNSADVTADTKGVYQITLAAHEEFDKDKIEITSNEVAKYVIDTEKCEITLYSVDGFCTKIVKYAVTNAKCTGAELLWTDNKTFDLSWNGSELIVDIKGNQTLDVKDLKDVLYVGHKDKSECKLGSFVIYDSVISAEGHEADDSLELIKNMNDLRIVITNEKGDSWTATVKVTNTTPSNN